MKGELSEFINSRRYSLNVATRCVNTCNKLRATVASYREVYSYFSKHMHIATGGAEISNIIKTLSDYILITDNSK